MIKFYKILISVLCCIYGSETRTLTEPVTHTKFRRRIRSDSKRNVDIRQELAIFNLNKKGTDYRVKWR